MKDDTGMYLDPRNPRPAVKPVSPAETMLAITMGGLVAVVILLLLYANKDWVLEVAKKIF